MFNCQMFFNNNKNPCSKSKNEPTEFLKFIDLIDYWLKKLPFEQQQYLFDY